MKYSEARQGRIFVIRLEDGEVVHEAIEKFARDQDIRAAALIVLGGADRGSTFVVGPAAGRSTPIIPMEHVLRNVHEVCGTGTLFPDDEGNPILHMHMACGRQTATVTGCIRTGVKVWHVMEIIIWELKNSTARRVFEKSTGFELMQPCADL